MTEEAKDATVFVSGATAAVLIIMLACSAAIKGCEYSNDLDIKTQQMKLDEQYKEFSAAVAAGMEQDRNGFWMKRHD